MYISRERRRGEKELIFCGLFFFCLFLCFVFVFGRDGNERRQLFVVVGLDALGIDGFFNTIQYFIDRDINLNSIKYIVPNGYSSNRRAPKLSLEVLKNQAADFTKGAIVLPPLQERSIIKNLQEKGISVFDNVELERYDHNQKEILKKDLLELFSLVKID